MSSAEPESRVRPLGTEGWTPVGEGERFFTLDALRGVAIFGVLVASVLTFAFPAWSPPAGR